MQDCTAGHNKSCLKALPQWNYSWMSSVSVWRSGDKSIWRDGLILIRIQTNTLINFYILLFTSVNLHLASAPTKPSSGRGIYEGIRMFWHLFPCIFMCFHLDITWLISQVSLSHTDAFIFRNFSFIFLKMSLIFSCLAFTNLRLCFLRVLLYYLLESIKIHLLIFIYPSIYINLLKPTGFVMHQQD